MAGSEKKVDEEAVAKFEKLGICRQLAEAAASLGWTAPTGVQEQAVPHLLAGKDVIGLAQTGSGKTGAFALPILQGLLDKPQALYALVLSPTRELAIQIAEQFEALGVSIGIRCAVLVGGIDLMSQAIALGRRPHILVGTPGRVVDHLSNTKGFTLKKVQHLVLDEADRLLNMDFEEEINQILKVLPKERRTQLFSATMTTKVAKLQRACLQNPVKVEVDARYTTVETLRQQYLFVPAKHKDCYLAYYLTELAGATFIIFTRTVDHARKLAYMLRALGFDAVPIHGQMSQPKRLAALNKFKGGERSILVATDVASRGLDIPAVDVVVNYELPTNPKDYVHRVGRTARAGRSGRSLTIVTQYDVEVFQNIERHIKLKMEEFQHEQDAVMLLNDHVAEASRMAERKMKEDDSGHKNSKKRHKGDGGGEDDELGSMRKRRY